MLTEVVEVAAAVTLLMTPTYEAESSVILIPDANLATGQLSINEVNLALSLTTTTADLAESSDVAASVASTLGLPFESVFGHVDGQSTLGLQLVTIEATADSAQQAADIANAVAREVADGDLRVGDAGLDQLLDLACVHRHVRVLGLFPNRRLIRATGHVGRQPPLMALTQGV